MPDIRHSVYEEEAADSSSYTKKIEDNASQDTG